MLFEDRTSIEILLLYRSGRILPRHSKNGVILYFSTSVEIIFKLTSRTVGRKPFSRRSKIII